MARFIDEMFVGLSVEEVYAEMVSMGVDFSEELWEDCSVEEDFDAYGELYFGSIYGEYYAVHFDGQGICELSQWEVCED